MCVCVSDRSHSGMVLPIMTSHDEFWAERTRECPTWEVHECSGVSFDNGYGLIKMLFHNMVIL